ncbi:MAG: hypothetical protein BMS9Abin29_0251 [Gemmatimonadota bacterium]|nr:MAG: hypothetical protein BMS9Abin29_0251 [Gemmatimonadota bacterium]
MIVRRYGENIESVEIAFDPNALNEIAFRRSRAFSMSTDQFQAGYVPVEDYSLTSEAEGPVHGETERALLDGLEAQIAEIRDALGEGEVLMVESQQGVDYPKTRGRQSNVVVDGENRLYFYASVDPPLRMVRYRKG